MFHAEFKPSTMWRQGDNYKQGHSFGKLLLRPGQRSRSGIYDQMTRWPDDQNKEMVNMRNCFRDSETCINTGAVSDWSSEWSGALRAIRAIRAIIGQILSKLPWSLSWCCSSHAINLYCKDSISGDSFFPSPTLHHRKYTTDLASRYRTCLWPSPPTMASMHQLPLQVATKKGEHSHIRSAGLCVRGCWVVTPSKSLCVDMCMWCCVCGGETLRSKFRFYIVFNVKGGNIIE